jgi:hypothetical protein
MDRKNKRHFRRPLGCTLQRCRPRRSASAPGGARGTRSGQVLQDVEGMIARGTREACLGKGGLALGFIDHDELVEITPPSMRLRKKILSASRRPKKVTE